MEVHALVGPSGSGKSHRARVLAYDHGIPLILDDGLLIKEGKILAGKSAKRENSKLAAIKRAIFHDESHCREVKRAIKDSGAEKILILGTSMEMVEKIVDKLELAGIDNTIMIDEIASPAEIERAITVRKNEGKHVIPVPKIEVKKQFLGYFTDSLRVLFNREQDDLTRESSIVRARFSYLGNLIVHNKVFRDIVLYFSDDYNGIAYLQNVGIIKEEDGLYLNISMVIHYGYEIPHYLENYRQQLAVELENFTGITVQQINLEIAGMEVSDDDIGNYISSRRG